MHCGFCTATCPTYVLLGDERDSPRGRIYLMKEMFEHDRPASPEVQRHVDRCLSCLSCMTTCPSGVDYMHLVDYTRAHIEETGSRGFRERLARALLAAILPYPDRFRLALRAARFARPFAGLLRRLGFKELVAMLELAPAGLLRGADFTGPGTAATKAERRRRVILLAGCAQQVLRPEINDATIRLLARRGVDVEVAPGAGCCGALVHHMGREAEAIAFAKRNIDAWTRLMDKGDRIDAVIVNASGCGTTVKDYAHMLAREPALCRAGGQARRHDARRDGVPRQLRHGPAHALVVAAGRVSLGVLHAARPAHIRGAAQAPAQRRLHRGRGAGGPPVLRLGRHLQHPAAGDRRRPARPQGRQHPKPCAPTWWRPATSAASRSSRSGMDIPIAHTVELLDWAYGGPMPRGLEALAKHVQDVPEAKPLFAVT